MEMEKSVSEKVDYEPIFFGDLFSRERKNPEKYKIDAKECFDRLRQVRSNSGLWQQDMADRLKIKVPAYSKIETGKVNITIERFEETLGVLGVPIEAFFCPAIHFWLLSEVVSEQKQIDHYKESLHELTLLEKQESWKSMIRWGKKQNKRSISQKLQYKSRNLFGGLIN
jgi:transcriptional regulator with XRE-family HTH domain